MRAPSASIGRIKARQIGLAFRTFPRMEFLSAFLFTHTRACEIAEAAHEGVILVMSRCSHAEASRIVFTTSFSSLFFLKVQEWGMYVRVQLLTDHMHTIRGAHDLFPWHR